MTNKPRATLFMMISVIMFAFMQLFINLTSPDISVFQQVFYRSLLNMLLCIYFIHKNKVSYLGKRENQPQLLLRSFGGFLGLLLTFYATRHANLADVSIVTRTSPLFTTIISVAFLKEKLSPIQVPILIIIFTGGWLVADPSFNSSFLPLGCALMAAICTGICYPLLRYFSDKEHGMTVIMHFSTVCAFSCVPFILKDFHIPQTMDIIYLALIATTGAIGQIFVTYAYRLSPASEITIYDQFTVVFSIILGFFFLNQIPTTKTIIGGTLIICASITTYLYNTNSKLHVNNH